MVPTFLLSIMSFAQGSKSPEKVPGWLSWSHTLLLLLNWSQGEAGPAHWATIGEHQHNYSTHNQEEQCPRRKFWIPYSGMDGWPVGNHRELGGHKQGILTTWINCPKTGSVAEQVGKDPCWCLTWLWPSQGEPLPAVTSLVRLEKLPGGILCTYHQLITEMKLVI